MNFIRATASLRSCAAPGSALDTTVEMMLGLALCAAGSTALLGVAGCNVTTHHREKSDDVSITTPLGGVDVKSDPSAVLSKVGLPQYPGSTPFHEDDGDKKSADVNLSFGNFHLRVLAAGLETPDNSGKVEAFYRKSLAQYSDVIACRHQSPVGTPVKTGMGLTCAEDKHVHTGDHGGHDNDRNTLELKAGSPKRQHIVALTPQGDGTRMELILLELPNDHDD